MALARGAPGWQSGSISSNRHGQWGRNVLSLLPSLATDRIAEKEDTSPCASVFILWCPRGRHRPCSLQCGSCAQVHAFGCRVVLPGQQVLTAAQGAPHRFDTRVPRQCSGRFSRSRGWVVSVSEEGEFYEGLWEGSFGVFQGWFVISFT